MINLYIFSMIMTGMTGVLGVLYGLHMVLVIYLITYLTVVGIARWGLVTLPLVMGKYLIYWGLIVFGFKYLPSWAILSGFGGGIYLSLPILYFVNKTAGKSKPKVRLKAKPQAKQKSKKISERRFK